MGNNRSSDIVPITRSPHAHIGFQAFDIDFRSIVKKFNDILRFLTDSIDPQNRKVWYASELKSHNSSFSHQAGEVPIVSSNFLRSLFLAALFSFFAPMLLMSGSLASTWLLTCIPGLKSIGQIPTNMLLDFLDTFGSGSPFQGMLTICLVSGFVGALFDIYAFYSFRTQKGN